MAQISGPGPGANLALPAAAAVPAQLGFLAIYNPSLGRTDETMEDQIVYYSSVTSPSTSPSRKQRRSSTQDPMNREERNERLRQIGLAQGMVEFGRSFSGDRPVDTVDTEKSRVVLHELEPGWWILASIDLTRLPLPPSKTAAQGTAPAAQQQAASSSSKGKTVEKEPEAAVEYSTREVKPAALLLQDLLRAHAVFLLHHDSSLSALFVRTKRARFTSFLARYWDSFLSSWNVMLHGNPLQNVFGGIKIAACGELGFGVGEEERGSGEREVLEGLVGRIDGLVDLVVSKFGEAADDEGKTKSEGDTIAEKWLGTGSEPGAEDGVIFLGVGALSRHSLRNVAYWMEDLYTWGENAYGVKESPTAARARMRRRRAASKAAVSPAAFPAPPAVPAGVRTPQLPEPDGPSDFKPPPPIVKAAPPAVPRPTETTNASASTADDADAGGMDKVMGYLKLGYGTYWSLGSSGPADKGHPDAAVKPDEIPAAKPRPSVSRTGSLDDAVGHYLVGLMGVVEEVGAANSTDDRAGDSGGETEHNSRILLRTLTVELESEGTDKTESQMSKDLGSSDTELAPSQQQKQQKSPASSSRTVKKLGEDVDDDDPQTPRDDDAARDGAQNQQTAFDSQDRNKTKKVRVVVYVNKPFVFTFLFNLRTDSLNWDAAYRSLHRQLAPLRKPLLASTSYRPDRPDRPGAEGGQRIYDLIWDPRMLTVHSTIPNIPAGNGAEDVWNRVEALNTHVQLLNMHAATRATDREVELERTAKTSRGWCLVWSRVLDREAPSAESMREEGVDDGDAGDGKEESTDDEVRHTQEGTVVGKEIFLICKSGDHGGGVRAYVGGGGVGGGSGGWADGASRLAQGIGVDTRRYIEGLLSLNR
jgi:hypothetical protein